ncbi:anthranilate synthase component ii, partial [Moniliophthora roreri]
LQHQRHYSALNGSIHHHPRPCTRSLSAIRVHSLKHRKAGISHFEVGIFAPVTAPEGKEIPDEVVSALAENTLWVVLDSF